MSTIFHIPRFGLGHKRKTIIARAGRDFPNESQYSAALINRFKILEADAFLSIADKEDRLRVSRDMNY
jgi:hypothetical protein